MIAGILGASSPGLASDYDRATLTSAVTPVTTTAPDNGLAATLVPQPTLSSPTLPVDATVTAAPRAAFASLAAAVAAQDMPTPGASDDEHLRCLASAIYFESKGEPLSGQLAVAQVILNRTKSGRFASNVCGVVKQRGQFGFVRGGAIPAIDATRAAYKTAVAVAKVAIAEAWETPQAANALYFNGVRAGLPGLKRVAVIGGHAFYR